MSVQAAKREALRGWLAQAGGIDPQRVTDDRRLIEDRVIGSLQVMDLILFLEQLRGAPLNPASLTPAAFATVDAICGHFLGED